MPFPLVTFTLLIFFVKKQTNKNIQLIFTTKVMRSPSNIHSGFQKTGKLAPEIKNNHFYQVIGPNLALTILIM